MKTDDLKKLYGLLMKLKPLLEARITHFTLARVKPSYGVPATPWHEWYAWYPIITWDGRLTRGMKVWRRKISLDGTTDRAWWQYARDDGYAP